MLFANSAIFDQRCAQLGGWQHAARMRTLRSTFQLQLWCAELVYSPPAARLRFLPPDHVRRHVAPFPRATSLLSRFHKTFAVIDDSGAIRGSDFLDLQCEPLTAWPASRPSGSRNERSSRRVRYSQQAVQPTRCKLSSHLCLTGAFQKSSGAHSCLRLLVVSVFQPRYGTPRHAARQRNLLGARSKG